MTQLPVVMVRARLWGAHGVGAPGGLHDVVIADGRVTEVAPSGTTQGGAGARVIDLDGRWLMPGLVDHHVHFTLWAKHRARLSMAGAASAAQVVERVRRGLVDLVDAGASPSEPLVGRGFQDALWPDVPTEVMLDEAAASVGQLGRAIVLISHDLHSVWINTAAAMRFGATAGLLRENAAFDLEIALEREEAADRGRIDALVRDAAGAASARGVTGIVDLEMADNPGVWAARIASGLSSLRVAAGVYPQHLDAALARGDRTGRRVAATHGLLTVGPLKIFADGSLNTRTAWCFDPYPHTSDYGHSAHARGDLVTTLADARDHGFEVALHAIGDRAVAEALDAFEQSGAVGSIEHAQLVRDEDVPRFARLGVAAGVQPEHTLDDRDVTDVLWKGRTGNAFPYGALAAAGATLRMGSDAPVAPLDPWMGISAAVHRTKDSRPAWEPGNALTIDQALRASWAAPSVSAGRAADLIAVDADPAALDMAALRSIQVAVTMTAGRVVHEAL